MDAVVIVLAVAALIVFFTLSTIVHRALYP